MADALNAPNYTEMFANAFNSGAKMAQQKGVRNALSMSQTDPTGAQGELMRYGAFDEANALGKYAADKKATDLQNKVGPMAASGDYEGAQREAVGGGDFAMADQLGKLNDSQRAHALESAQVLAGIGLRLKDVPYEQRKAALQNATPYLAERGIKPEQIAAFDPTDQNIDAVVASSMSLKEQLDARDKADTRTEAHRHNLATEDPVRYEKVTDGDGTEHLVQVGGNSGAGAAPAAGGQGGGVTPPGDRGTASSPRGLRNNNPLNLEASVNWNGMTGSDGRYAQFASPADGWAAADKNLQTYATKHGLNTVAGIINRWAPASDNPGGATQNYIASVAHDLGVDPNAPINMQDSAVRHNLAQAMASFENGRPVSWGTGGDVGAPPASGGAAPAGGARELWTGTPKPNEVGNLSPEAIENAALKYNSTGQMPSFGMGKAAVALKEQVLNRAAVLAAADGTTDGGVLRVSIVKSAQSALTKISQRQSFVRTAATAASANADLMLDIAPKGAGPSGVPIFNRYLQAGRKSIAGDPDVTRFDSAYGGFAEEYAKVMTGNTTGSAATDSARHAADARMSRFATVEQLRAGVDQMKKEMANVEAANDKEVQTQQDIIRTGGRSAVAAASDPASPAVKAALPDAASKAHDDFQAHRGVFSSAPKYSAKAPLGSANRPYVATDQKTMDALDKLHKGSWVISPDGQYGQFR